MFIYFGYYALRCAPLHICFSFLFPTLIPLSGVGTTCFHHVVIKIRHLFFTTGRLPSGCKCSQAQQLNVASEARNHTYAPTYSARVSCSAVAYVLSHARQQEPLWMEHYNSLPVRKQVWRGSHCAGDPFKLWVSLHVQYLHWAYVYRHWSIVWFLFNVKK
jgi:hypothetical protein